MLQQDFVVFETGAAPDALALAERLPLAVDVLLTDLGLPGMSGVELAHAWRARRPESRIVFLTGQFEPPQDSPAQSGFVHKPFSRDALLRALL